MLLSALSLARGQVPTPAGSGLGEAVVASASVWGAAANPAAGVPRPEERAAWFGVQAYGVSLASPADLTRIGLDVSWRPSGGGTRFEAGAQYFDPPGFGVSAFRVGAQRALSEGLSAGLRLGLLYADYRAYGSAALAMAEGGLQYGVTNALVVAAHYSYVGRDLSPLTQSRLRIGVEYLSSRRVRLLAAVSQAVGEPLNGQLGIDYQPDERLRLRAGYQTLGERISFASSYALGSGMELSLAAVVFSRLPLGVGYGVTYER